MNVFQLLLQLYLTASTKSAVCFCSVAAAAQCLFVSWCVLWQAILHSVLPRESNSKASVIDQVEFAIMLPSVATVNLCYIIIIIIYFPLYSLSLYVFFCGYDLHHSVLLTVELWAHTML